MFRSQQIDDFRYRVNVRYTGENRLILKNKIIWLVLQIPLFKHLTVSHSYTGHQPGLENSIFTEI